MAKENDHKHDKKKNYQICILSSENIIMPRTQKIAIDYDYDKMKGKRIK
jgi:hypothetical protein